MHQELIRELAMITDEERRILEGKQEIDPQLYTEKKEMVVDSAKLLKKGKLIQVRPHTRFVHFPAHTHNYIEVIYMCQGTTTHIVNGNQVVLDTEMNGRLNEEERQDLMDEIPSGRFADPEEVAELALKLTDTPAYMTGQIIGIDGGFI